MDKEENRRKSIKKRDRSRSRSVSPNTKHISSNHRSTIRDRDRDRDRSRERKSSKKDKRDRSRDRSPDRSKERGRDRSHDRYKDKNRAESDSKRDEKSRRFEDRDNNINSNNKIESQSQSTVREALTQYSAEHWAEEREAQKQKENAQLEEEIRKRKERVKAWQEAKRISSESLLVENGTSTNEMNVETKDTSNSNNSNNNSSSDTNKSSSHNINGISDERMNDTEMKVDELEHAEPIESNGSHNKKWSLEDDEEEDMVTNEAKLTENDGTQSTLSVTSSSISINVPEFSDDIAIPITVPDLSHVKEKETETIVFDASTVKLPRKRKMRFSTSESPIIKASPDIHQVSSVSSKPVASQVQLITSSSHLLNATTTTSTTATMHTTLSKNLMEVDEDPLDAFMSNLYESGQVETQKELKTLPPALLSSSSSSSKSILSSIPNADGQSEDEDEYSFYTGTGKVNPFGTNFITLDQLLGNDSFGKGNKPVHISTGWESDIGGNDSPPGPNLDDMIDMTDEEREAREEKERQEFMEAIRKAQEEEDMREKQRQEHLLTKDSENRKVHFGESMIKVYNPDDMNMNGVGNNNNNSGSNNTGTANITNINTNELGRIFADDGDIQDEENLNQVKQKSVMDVLEEAKKGKELKPVDHSTITYIPFRKNIFIVPKALAKLTKEEIKERREALSIVVRGKECPAPVENWEQCGLSDRILEILQLYKLEAPFAIQQQAIPAIMCGRDIIGVAKTGSGKTLAFLLPLIRHIQDQPPLKDGEGPIGLIMAPARELALQIRNEAKKFTKYLNLRVACVYGGAAVTDQIADLKRGSEIVVCTPGRMIELLCMQAGKMISLRRVTMVILDEADRMFDMGFESQIRMIIQNIRPDHQTVLFSATFPKQIEKLAKSMLQYPLEIIVGERSSVNKDITQIIEVHEEEDKYLRLLQILGIWYEKGSVLVFVDKQEKCDSLYSELLKSGYPCVSLHGGKDQVDRDYTIHQFKTGVFNLMVATSVAGRGLDVPEIVCVVNYNCPNHLEDYVHRVGRTGRAGRKGIAYTFISSKEEQYAPIMIKVLEKAKVENIPKELIAMNEAFQEKVAKGEAHYVGNGFVGKGYKFDASEMNEQQKTASLQKRQYDLENGLLPEDDGGLADIESDEDTDIISNTSTITKTKNLLSSSSSSGNSVGNVVHPNSTVPILSTTLGTLSTSISVPTPVPASISVPVSVPVVGTPAAVAQVGTNLLSTIVSTMTPIERARALVGQMSGRAIIPPVSVIIPTPAPVIPASDPKAAMTKALMLARQLGSSTESNLPTHYSDEFEINDYPPQARRKLAQRQVMEDILERTGATIISKGAYVPPGKKLEPGERKLYLLIEGDNELAVKQAKLEIQRVLDEETLRVGVNSTASTGRYSVI